MRMTEEQLNKAYFECYTEMKQRHSNAELGLGNGKNIAIANYLTVNILSATAKSISFHIKCRMTIFIM